MERGITMTEKPNEMKGTVKEKAGRLLGDKQMEAEGTAEKDAAVAQRKVEGVVEEVKGTVKAAVGAAMRKRRLQAEGEAERAKGRIKRS
jgi:uncharacterized protein YjbJ (UPF0337 family)